MKLHQGAMPLTAPWQVAVQETGFGVDKLLYDKAELETGRMLQGAEAVAYALDKEIVSLVDRWWQRLYQCGPSHHGLSGVLSFAKQTVVAVPLPNAHFGNFTKGKGAVLAEHLKFILHLGNQNGGPLWVVAVNRNDGKLWVAELVSHRLEHHAFATTQLYKAAVDKQYGPPTRVRASQITDCQRKLWYEITQQEETDSVYAAHPEYRVSAALGNAYHRLFEQWLTETGLAVQTEFKVDIPGVLGGKVDAELELADNKRVLYDLKTIKRSDFTAGTRSPKIKKYFAQLSTYAAVLGATHAVVVLLDRDTGELRDLELVVDTEYGKSLLNRAKLVMAQVREDHLPVPDPEPMACRFCPFQTRCAADGNKPGQ